MTASVRSIPSAYVKKTAISPLIVLCIVDTFCWISVFFCSPFAGVGWNGNNVCVYIVENNLSNTQCLDVFFHILVGLWVSEHSSEKAVKIWLIVFVCYESKFKNEHVKIYRANVKAQHVLMVHNPSLWFKIYKFAFSAFQHFCWVVFSFL